MIFDTRIDRIGCGIHTQSMIKSHILVGIYRIVKVIVTLCL